MTPTTPTRLLLGPQRPVTNLGDEIKRSGIPDGRIAVISAGWQEAEGDIDDVRQIAGRELVDLGLYSRAESLMKTHAGFHEAYRKRQEKLKELQRLYRLRLRQLMIAARRTLRAEGDPELLVPEQRHAIAQLRALDRHHLHRVRGILTDFGAEYDTNEYEPIAEQAAEVRSIIESSNAVLITGGNVVVLLNRLLLFGVAPMLRQAPVIAWSAGAMALTDNIVLFHDRTPQGRRDPEILGPGLGELAGYVLLPDAKNRIREKDLARTGSFSRRFAPDVCVALDSGSVLQFDGDTLVRSEQARRLTPRGGFAQVTAA
ncbi:MAG: type 1 glutamine amidotransferase-like domain-containing protein [Woeseiaceae bacterium]|nr:type 1 glutamine amidotransferase-like domain-containing protein [Woeseiaceae bacterium]